MSTAAERRRKVLAFVAGGIVGAVVGAKTQAYLDKIAQVNAAAEAQKAALIASGLKLEVQPRITGIPTAPVITPTPIPIPRVAIKKVSPLVYAGVGLALLVVVYMIYKG